MALTTLLHFACSRSRNAAYSCGVPGEASPPTLAYCSVTAGDFRAATAAALSRFWISAGVAAGTTRPYQLSEVTFGRLASAVVGTSGSVGARLALRSEEHTSELQSQSNLVCRLL